jgi:hypothetical protein
MSHEAAPENYKDAMVREDLQSIANSIKARLPQGWGFCLICVPLGDDEQGRVNYVSNANRDDVIKMLKNFIQRNEFGKHSATEDPV